MRKGRSQIGRAAAAKTKRNSRLLQKVAAPGAPEEDAPCETEKQR